MIKLYGLIVGFLVIIGMTIFQSWGNVYQIECSFERHRSTFIRLDTKNSGYFSGLTKFIRVEFQPETNKLEKPFVGKFATTIFEDDLLFEATELSTHQFLRVRVGKNIYDIGYITHECAKHVRSVVTLSKLD